MEKFKLKMNFRGNFVYVNVEDTDKCLLLDVINDLYDESEKSKMPLPTHPTISYCYAMKSHELLGDSDLVQMFSRFEGKSEIDIWVGCGSNPSNVLLLARRLRQTQKNSDAPPATFAAPSPVGKPQHRNKLQCRRSTTTTTPIFSPIRSARLSQESDNVDDIIIHEGLPEHSPDASDSHIDLVTIDHVTIDQASPPRIDQRQQDSQPLSLRRSPRFRQPILNETSLLEITQNEPETTLNEPETTQNEPVPPPRFKLSKYTAKLKGVFVPKVRKSAATSGGQSSQVQSRGVRVEYADEGEFGDSSESDRSYMPSDSDEINDERDISDLEDEDNNILNNLEMIDDGYDPYATTEWSVDVEDGFLSKMLENCEIYDDKVFGEIRLRPWMLFMDKEHFKDTLKDFCIQEGFYVIVSKADKFRYTAECASVGCDWRVHASVLQDGTTWAIKSIRNIEHGCVGVRDHNPMANAEWAARKMLEDIRANPSIPGTSLQKLLMEKYGLEMKSSTMYRMREREL